MKSTIPGDLLKTISDNCSILQQPEAATLVGSKRLVKRLERKKREMRCPSICQEIWEDTPVCRALHMSHILGRLEKALKAHLCVDFATYENQSLQNEGENHMILSIDKKKHLTEVNTFTVKALNMVGTEENGGNMLKAMCVSRPQGNPA